MAHIIYRLTNSVTNKIYIGITSTSLSERLAGHKHAAKVGSKFILHQSIRKHGWDKFIAEEIFSAFDEINAKEMEKHFIAEYKTYGKGYNMTPGGDGGPCSPEKAAAISKAKKGMDVPWVYGNQNTKDMRWWTNGTINKLFRDGIDAGPEFKLGRTVRVGRRTKPTIRPKFPNGYRRKSNSVVL